VLQLRTPPGGKGSQTGRTPPHRSISLYREVSEGRWEPPFITWGKELLRTHPPLHELYPGSSLFLWTRHRASYQGWTSHRRCLPLFFCGTYGSPLCIFSPLINTRRILFFLRQVRLEVIASGRFFPSSQLGKPLSLFRLCGQRGGPPSEMAMRIPVSSVTLPERTRSLPGTRTAPKRTASWLSFFF